MLKPKVFIGSSSNALKTAESVKSELEQIADVVIWNDLNFFGLGAGTLEALIASLDEFDFAVFLMTPDDPIIHQGQPKFKPRDNVLIEYGLYAGALGRDRSIAMMSFSDPLHVPSDVLGITVAELRKSENPEHVYDVKAGCARIAETIRTKGFRHRAARELGVLYRLVNALTFPHYEDVHVPALQRARIKYRLREVFDSVDDVIEFMSGLLSDYVYSHLSFKEAEALRIYFAYYLGAGADDLGTDADPRVCWDTDSQAERFAGEFIIALANPKETVGERDWRVGRAIKGYQRGFPLSMCAKVFQSGRRDGFEDVRQLPHGSPNYKTPEELTVFSFPVEWRSDEGSGRVGVLTISGRFANSISPDLKSLLDLVANIVGFLFSVYGTRTRSVLMKEGFAVTDERSPLKGVTSAADTEEARRFAAAVTGLRRRIAGHFETAMVAQGRHRLVDGDLEVVAAKRTAAE